MKKLLVAMLVFAVLAGVAHAEMSMEKKQTYMTLAENNITTMINALAVYANAHDNKYPTPEMFYSRHFDKYIEEVLGEEVMDTDRYYKDSPYGFLRYSTSWDRKSYKIWAPHAYMYDLEKLYFDLHEGYIVKEKMD